MIEYTQYRNRIKENISRFRDFNNYLRDGIAPDRIIFTNNDNIYYGTFVGQISANELSLTNCTIDDSIIRNSDLIDVTFNVDGKQITPSDMMLNMSEISTTLEKTKDQLQDFSTNTNLSLLCLSTTNTILSTDISSLSNEIDKIISDGSNIYVDNKKAKSLSVIHISQDEYQHKISSNSIISNEIYVILSTYPTAYGKKIIDVAIPELSSDAATKGYIDINFYNKNQTSSSTQIKDAIDNIYIPTDLSAFSNSTGYVASTDISNYCYLKNQTSSSTQIKDAIDNIYIPTDLSAFSNSTGYVASTDISNYCYLKNQTSSSNEIDNALDVKLEADDVNIDYDSSLRKIFLSAKEHITSIDCNDFIKDGMLSTVELCNTTLVLTFNTDAGNTPISIELSNFVDNYDSKINSLSTAIDQKIYIDSISSQSLSAIHISQEDFYQKVIASAILSNELYVVSSNYINAYDTQIKNVAKPEEKNDASTKQYVDEACESALHEVEESIEAKLKNYYTKSETSSSSEISTAFEDALSANVVKIGLSALVAAQSSNVDVRSVAIGKNANASNIAYNNAQAVAIGPNSKAIGEASIAVGSNAEANGVDASSGGLNISIGYRAKAEGKTSIAIGSALGGAASSSPDSYAYTKRTGSIAIGTNAKAYSQYDTVIGISAVGADEDKDGNSQTGSVSLGALAIASGSASTAVGHSAIASGIQSIAIGRNANASNTRAIAIGAGQKALTNPDDQTTASGQYAIAIGFGVKATADHSIAIGGTSTSNDAIVSRADASNAVQIGIGVNSEASSLQFIDYQLVNAQGKIPVDRLNIDVELLSTSINPVQNKAIAKSISSILSSLEKNDDEIKYKLDERYGGNISGNVAICEHDLKILSGNYIQTTNPAHVYNYSSKNTFIQAEEAFSGSGKSYGPANTGSYGYCVLSVINSASQHGFKLSGDISKLTALLNNNAVGAGINYDYSASRSLSAVLNNTSNISNALFSLTLGDQGETMKYQISSIDQANGVIYLKQAFSTETAKLTSLSEAQCIDLWENDDNAFYVAGFPEIGNAVVKNFYAQHVEGGSSRAVGKYTHAEGRDNIADVRYSHAEGSHNIAASMASHAEGFQNKVFGKYAHVEGNLNVVNGNFAHAEGRNTAASGNQAHAEGFNTVASGAGSHAEGGDGTNKGGTATGAGSHAEGLSSLASSIGSHAEGWSTYSIGYATHAEGIATSADARGAHAEGGFGYDKSISSYNEAGQVTKSIVSNIPYNSTFAHKMAAHTEGAGTYAEGFASHAEGCGSYVKAGSHGAHAEGGEVIKVLCSEYDLSNRLSAKWEQYECINSTSAMNVAAHAEGLATYASGKASHAAGISAVAAGNYSYVWNGISSTNYNPSTGDGTFCINPVDSTNGFYIGNQNLCSIISNEIKTNSTNVWLSSVVEGQPLSGGKLNQLNIVKFDSLDSYNLCSDLLTLSDIALIDENTLNAENERILSVADPEEETDAANKRYVDGKLSGIQQDTAIQNFYNAISANGITGVNWDLAISAMYQLISILKND